MSLLSLNLPRFGRQQDWDAVADREGELGGFGNQLILVAVVAQRALGERADEQVQELRVDGDRFALFHRGLLQIGAGIALAGEVDLGDRDEGVGAGFQIGRLEQRLLLGWAVR
jgi:hypothetical protein